jgi:ABC-2 type transport system ATP-binding protein
VDVLQDPVKVRKLIGYLPEVLPLYMDMEVRDYLEFVGRARGLHGGKLKERVHAVVDATGLEPMFRKVVRELSKGFRQRTALAQALIHDPEVIILDEPTSGLDPHQILEIRDLIARLAKEKTVILSTHILQEVETTADRIVIINRGEIVGDGSIGELRQRAKNGERLAFSAIGERADLERKLSSVDGVRKVEYTKDVEGCPTFLVHSPQGRHLWREVSQLAQQQQWQVRELSEKPLSLEETFLTLTEKAIQGNH